MGWHKGAASSLAGARLASRSAKFNGVISFGESDNSVEPS